MKPLRDADPAFRSLNHGGGQKPHIGTE